MKNAIQDTEEYGLDYDEDSDYFDCSDYLDSLDCGDTDYFSR